MTDETTQAPAQAPAETPAETPAAEAPRAPAEEQSIADILAYDPFEPKEGDGEQPPAQKPSKETKEPPENEAEEQQQQQPAKPPQGEEPGGLKTVLEQLLADRQREPEPAAPVKEPEKPKPRFAVQVPEPILQGIRSDDPAENAQAINGLVNGVLNASYNAVIEHIEKAVMPRITETVQTANTSRDARQEFHDQFYGSYPELNKPELKPYIFMTAQMLVREKGKAFTGVTPEFQKEVADRVKGLFNVQAAPAKEEEKPPARKQFNSGPTTRSTTPDKDKSGDIMDTLFG